MTDAKGPRALVRLPERQNTEEWLAKRRTGVTASMMPIITSNKPGLLQLWSENVGLLEPSEPDEETQELFDLGHLLEPVIAVFYKRKTGRPVKRVGQMVRHPDIPWAFASLDRVSAIRGERRIVELKYAPHRWGDDIDEVPAVVQDQVQWQLFVTGYEVADVAVLRYGKVEVIPIPAKPAYQENLLKLARWFYALVESGTPPPVDDSDSTRKTLQRMFPRDTEGFIEPTAELAALALAVRTATVERKSAEGREKRLKNALRIALGEHAGVESDELGFRVTWRKQRDSTETVTDWEAVARGYRWLLEAQVQQLDGLADPPDSALVPFVHSLRPEELDAVVGIHTNTITKPGKRVLSARFRANGRWEG